MATVDARMQDRITRGKAWIADVKSESPEQLSARMRESATRFLAELEGLSDADVHYTPGEGQWCVREVCLHVDHAVTRTAVLVPTLASGTSPQGIKAVPGELSADPGDFSKVVESLKSVFKRAEEAASSLSDTPNLTLTFDHPFFGPLNCREWMAFNVMHLNVHVNQVKRVKDALKQSKGA